jgi:hypothetical protein
MQVEIQRIPTSPGYLRYRVRAAGELMEIVETTDQDLDLLAEILEAAVEGIFRRADRG